MIFVDPRNPKPLHEQIKESVLEQITLGVLAPGDRLPSVRETAQSTQIAPNTIQRAYRELEAGGVISSYPGRGSFITMQSEGILERKIKETVDKFTRAASDLKKLGVAEDDLIKSVREVYG